MIRRFNIILWSTVWFLLILAFAPQALYAQPNADLDLERIRRATVFIIQAGGDNLNTRCVGTGTIVRFDGLILTNAHNTVPNPTCPGGELIIALTLTPDEPPIPKYRAEIVQTNIGLDLALLRITRELDGRIIEPASLPVLPFVELAPSQPVDLDQTITVVGYPDLGNASIQSIVGAVSGFIAEPSGGEQSWIKVTSLEPISGVMSGGGAYNQLGQLIGIPTSAPAIAQATPQNCRLLEDTNRDGFINNNDSCVPISDFITVLRPVEFARPLIRGASLGLSLERLSEPVTQGINADPPDVSRLFFAPSIANNLPTRVIGSAPAGTTSLYLVFDYENFVPETVYEVRVSVDGVPNAQFSLPPVRWSGGEDGLWYVGSSGQVWPNGVYEFRILVDGTPVATTNITVGGVAQETASFSNIAFGLLDEANNLAGESYVLPTGTTAVARFIYRNMQPGLPWTIIWYYNGAILERRDNVWTEADGTDGSRTSSIRQGSGAPLPAGNYRVELYIGATPRLSAIGDFVIAGEAQGVLPAVFEDVEFLRASEPLAPPTGNPTTAFPDGVNTLYTQFDWQRIVPGTLWTLEWSVDGTVFYEQTTPWRNPEVGTDYLMRLTAPGGLPDGTYTVNLFINGILLETSQFTVGIGQLAINQLDQAGGVQLRGQIVDADTGQGIEGATFILITIEFSVADFVWDQEQIYALAVTDRDGRFEIDRALRLDNPYSVIIQSVGYLPIQRDAFTITEEILADEGGSPIDMYIPMVRD